MTRMHRFIRNAMLFALLAAASVVAAEPDSALLPANPAMWLNSPPLSAESLKGKGVFLWFFEETCPSCRGKWPGMESRFLMPAPLTPLCTPSLAAQLRGPADLSRFPLLRSYFVDDWRLWFEAAQVVPSGPINGPIFDSSVTMVQCALQGLGIALAPPAMFEREIAEGRLLQPFEPMLDAGGYWLTRLALKPASVGATAFATWLEGECGSRAGVAA